MATVNTKNGLKIEGWIIAAGAGLVAFGVAVVVGDFDLTPAGFIGAVIFLLVGLILGMPWGAAAKPVAKEDGLASTAVPVSAPVTMAPAAAVSAPSTASPTMAEALAADPVVMSPPPAPVAAPAPVADAPAASFVAPVPLAPAAAAPTAAVRAAPKTVAKAAPKTAAKAAPKDDAKAAPKVKAAAKPSAEPKVAKAKKADGPERLKAPRKGGADDLKEIEGIGPAMEKLCNEMGFFHFDQIANWSPADVAWVDQNMKTFKGRIERDKWVAQAKLIVAEGLDAFRIRAKTNDY